MPESNQFKQTPGRALLAFAIAACLVAVYTVVDAGRRGQQEGVDLPTALGDAERFEFPAFDHAAAVLEFGGRPLYRLRGEPLDRFDKYMFKSGRDDADQCFLYRYGKPLSEKTPEGIYYVKVGDGSYIELGVDPKGENASEE